jgi:L-aminopeptidase/D-esterase-like protein
MSCNRFKGGIGTSSRLVPKDATTFYALGVLVQCNYAGDLQILGVPITREISGLAPCIALDEAPSRKFLQGAPRCGTRSDAAAENREIDIGRGSIVVIVATDAPMLPHQLERIAKRVGMGLGRVGSWAGNSSGDLFLAFSTANRQSGDASGVVPLAMLQNDALDAFFQATIQATEEAIVNSMLASPTMTGADGLRVSGLPGDRVMAALRKYGRAN